ncbi:MAG: GTPase ObgE [Sandaracinus sp.]|nr:GTPase ObgE [Sandaracinus sp.]MCB9615660.1 GTPase ObgE [Sandaracinus sp.]
MQFIDEIEIEAAAGNGGNGAVAFRRESHRPLGGPSGGNGGNGGNVVLHAHDRLTTLLDLGYRRRIRAQEGENGRGKDQYGAAGKDEVVQVPVGTQVYDAETGELLADLDQHDQKVVICKGGLGGRGNMHFATPYDRAPRRAEDGTPGERKMLRLELKLLADVGLVGYPNVGKSTFIASVSRARPKIADYPFTTLVPNLGVVSLGDERSFVVADIPGIIEGAAEGAGLGIRFLRHVERNRVLLHLITVDPDPERDPVKDYDVLVRELAEFSPTLAERPVIVAVSKTDIPEVVEALPRIQEELAARGVDKVYPFSSATRDGMQELLLAIEATLKANPRESMPAPVTPVERQELRRRRGAAAELDEELEGDEDLDDDDGFEDEDFDDDE